MTPSEKLWLYVAELLSSWCAAEILDGQEEGEVLTIEGTISISQAPVSVKTILGTSVHCGWAVQAIIHHPGSREEPPTDDVEDLWIGRGEINAAYEAVLAYIKVCMDAHAEHLSLAELEADLQTGILTEEQFHAELAKAEGGEKD